VHEIELKAVVPDLRAACARMERAGAKLTFSGRLEDRRYDDAGGTMTQRDHVLRLRTYRNAPGVGDGGAARSFIDWKGPTGVEQGYKVREELSTPIGDPASIREILARLGYVIIQEIDRDIAQYELEGVTVRFETYPKMDVLVEVEGPPAGIERVIAILEMPRASFCSLRLADFAAQYEARTGQRAGLSEREMPSVAR
jgi:adenylate cyclase class IV